MKTRKSVGAAVTRSGTQAATAAASAILLALALAACAPSAPTATPPSPTPATSAPSATPLPTPEPLIIPGCETLLPLSTAKSIFSDSTEVLNDDDSVPIYGYELPEVAAASSNASIAKHCVWGVPNSDGGFGLTVTDITEVDAENLTTALLAAGFLGSTVDGVTKLELSGENLVGTNVDTHYFVGDLWIHSSGSSSELTTSIADGALNEVRAANPTRTY